MQEQRGGLPAHDHLLLRLLLLIVRLTGVPKRVLLQLQRHVVRRNNRRDLLSLRSSDYDLLGLLGGFGRFEGVSLFDGFSKEDLFLVLLFLLLVLDGLALAARPGFFLPQL